LLWDSKQWNNGQARTIEAGQTDPDDPNVKLLKVGDILPTCIIDGKGTAKVTGSSPRLYINVPNQNVKLSFEVLVEKSVSQLYISARSNHEDRPDGFGGYPLYADIRGNIFFKKELTHEIGYSSRLASKDIEFPIEKWIKGEVTIRNIDNGKVECTGIFNGVTTKIIDDGKIVIENDPSIKSPPFIGVGKWCFLRTMDPDGVYYRNVSIRAT
jgi:hypothetical protein